VIGALGLGDDELPGDELDRVTIERAKTDEPIVLGPSPSANHE